ncbi:MAG: hypothetical protein JSV03_00870 [Planctomycetota bacterium]|nr:MAG: hypothetical protein JSV03_00870 [Planctomycetota bacterium]
MPVYLHCPHCDHPQVVPTYRRGKTIFCRQCGKAYRTSKNFNFVKAVSASSISELQTRSKAAKNVYLLET